ncbi:MAG: SPASM domain-containing protein [Anaerolineaceae bacterium]|nr:SPASM domain-containing protein [Anaerolineaceae bacterium]
MYLKTLGSLGRRYKIARRHLTLKKVYNLMKIYGQYVLNQPTINTMPAFLKIEASRKCTVNCKYCQPKKEERFFPLPVYKDIVDKLSPWVVEVSLYDIGEPLWCEELLEFIGYAHQKNMGTSISTSLSLEKPREYWGRLVLSGLDYLIVALDGVSEEVYKKYRTNGDYQLVMQNLQAIIEAKRKHNPQLMMEWQMIEFDWNRHEIADARRMAKELGMDFKLIQEATNPRKETQDNDEYTRTRNCLLPYLVFIVNAYGEVNPCYKYYNPHMSIGSIKENTFEDIWNNNEIHKIRDKRLIHTRQICCRCNE